MRTMLTSTRRHVTRTAMLALSVTLALAGRSFAEGVLDRVPAGALVVIKINDLGATSTKIGQLATHLGLDLMQPKLADPLASLKEEMKIGDGLDDHGEMAFVFLDPKGGNPEQSMMFLVPTTNYAALVGAIEGSRKDGKLTVIKAKDGTDTYIADWKGYAVASPNRELVATPPTETLELPKRAARELAGNDIVVYANIAGLREPLGTELNKNRGKARQDMLDQMERQGQVPEAFQPALGAVFDQVFNGFDAFLRDTDAATVGLTFTDAGIRENIVAEFTPGSYLGNLTTQLRGTNEPLMGSIPDGDYLIFGGFRNSPKVVNQLITDISGPIIEALPKKDANAGMVPEYVTDLQKMVSTLDSQSFALVAPKGRIGEEGIIQLIATARGNPDQILDATRDFNVKYAEFTNSLMAEAQGVQMTTTWTDDVREIAGVNFNTLTTQVTGDTPQARQAMQGMQFMYGADRVEVLIGKTDDEVLSFLGVSDELITRTVEAAEKNDAPLAELTNVMAVSEQLPKNRVGELYIAVDQIASSALRAANQIGVFQGNVQLPPDLEPIGLSLSVDGSTLEGTAFISSDLMQAMISAGIQVRQRMQGGGRRGGGGL